MSTADAVESAPEVSLLQGKARSQSLWGSGYKALYRSVSRLPKNDYLDRPVFVVACGRSGSTALCSALGKHSRLLMAASEGPNVSSIGHLAYDYAFSRHSEYFQNAVQLPLPAYREVLRTLVYQSLFGTDYGYSYHPYRMREKNSVYLSARRLGCWGGKVFPDEQAATGLAWLFPRVKYVYLFRNGIDVVESMSKFGAFSELTFEQRCAFWSRHIMRYDFLRTHEDAISIRFEEFLFNAAGVLTSVFQHLGLDYQGAPIEFATSTLVHSRSESTKKVNPREVLMARAESSSSWTDQQKSAFETHCAAAMKLLGYPIPF